MNEKQKEQLMRGFYTLMFMVGAIGLVRSTILIYTYPFTWYWFTGFVLNIIIGFSGIYFLIPKK